MVTYWAVTDDDRVFKALADPTRRRILDLLRARPRTTGELCGSFGTTRFAVMKHLDEGSGSRIQKTVKARRAKRSLKSQS